MIYIHSPASLLHDPVGLSPDHPDNPSRLVATEAALNAADGDDLHRHEASAASPRDLGRVHSEGPRRLHPRPPQVRRRPDRPPGHHAERDRAMGFCLFNNTAIAAELAISEYGVPRELVIDWDVHHGNDTAETVRHRADVLFCDIHQTGLFPGTGALADTGSGSGRGYTVNLPVSRRARRGGVLSLLEHLGAESAAPDPLITPRAASHLGHRRRL